jgi:hypothetical protein
MDDHFVPESVIVYLLKHSQAFDWACINCECQARHTECPVVRGGKWQSAQGETGLDFVAKLRSPHASIIQRLPEKPGCLVLEAKGDRVNKRNGTYIINRPAYNEMVGSLSAFLVSKLDRIRREDMYLFGWLFTTNFLIREIETLSGALRNLPLVLPAGAAFAIGVFKPDKFWEIAPQGLRDLANRWFVGPEHSRNQLLRDQMSNRTPLTNEALLSELFDFNVVIGDTKSG